jgi:very-short-patch-repair endonuclease
MLHIHYSETAKGRGRALRKQGILGEVLLWEKLRRRQMCGYQFNRQKPLDKYIVDFYCRKLNLVIEVDGASHQEDQAHLADENRENTLRAMGLSVLRFSEKEVRHQMPAVLERISQWIGQKERESP